MKGEIIAAMNHSMMEPLSARMDKMASMLQTTTENTIEHRKENVLADPGCEHEDADDNADYADPDHERDNTLFSNFVLGDALADDSADYADLEHERPYTDFPDLGWT
eukprot:11217548-Heterocapsa_arctica.AAC.1